MPLMAKAQNSQINQSNQNSKKIENDLKRRSDLKTADSRFLNNSSLVTVGKGI